jgi:hypothetical protein
MKIQLKHLLFGGILFFALGFSAQAQIYVSIRPSFPVIVRTPQPQPTYIWIEEDWELVGGAYRYSGGHWASPPQQGYYHSRGYWKASKHGSTWVKGRWQAKNVPNGSHHKGNGKHNGHHKNKH